MPTFVAHDGPHSWNDHRRGSLEEALYAICPTTERWSVELIVPGEPSLVVASREIGIDPTYTPHPSLLARQILATLSLHDDARALLGEDSSRGSLCVVETGSDDPDAPGGERWYILPPTASRDCSSPSSSPRPRSRPRRPNPDSVRFELEEPTASTSTSGVDLATITIHHAVDGGHVVCRARIFRRLLELRATTAGLWDLVVLNQDKDGSARSSSKGVYLAGLDSDLYLIASCLGIRTKQERDPAAIPSTWRPGTFEIVDTANEDENGNEAVRRPVLGFVRGPIKHPGIYGIDHRTVEMTYGEGKSWEYKRTDARWHLTHIGTGYLILHTKRRKSAEQIADALLRQVPELNGVREKGEMTSGLRELAQRVIEEAKEEHGGEYRWDR